MHARSDRRFSGPTAVAALISLFIFVYVAMRAAMISITHDEALTYAWHVTGDWLKIVLFRTPGLPDNNHVLHTLLCKISVSILGLSELTLRIPSLLGCLLYLLGLNLCLRRIIPGWLQVFGLLAIGLNPYVLDFLGLARGYGLGLGFTMVGLAALLASLAESPGKIRQAPAQLSMILFSLATLSNLSFLLVMGASLAVMFIAFVYAAIHARRESVPSGLPLMMLLKIVMPVFPVLAYLLIPLKIIHDNKLFDMGGHTGFWEDTVNSLTWGTLYDSKWLTDQDWMMDAWIIATLFVLPFVLWALSRSDRRRFTALSVIVAMTAIIVTESLVQHALLNVAFLQGRRGIFLIPLFMLASLTLCGLPKKSPLWIVVAGWIAGAAVPAILGVNGLQSTNLQYVSDWKNDAGNRNVMLAIKEIILREKPSSPLHMRVDWVFEPTTNFYRHTLGLESSLLPLDRKGLDGPADLYYGMAIDEGAISKKGVRLVRREPVSGAVLFESVKPVVGR